MKLAEAEKRKPKPSVAVKEEPQDSSDGTVKKLEAKIHIFTPNPKPTASKVPGHTRSGQPSLTPKNPKGTVSEEMKKSKPKPPSTLPPPGLLRQQNES